MSKRLLDSYIEMLESAGIIWSYTGVRPCKFLSIEMQIVLWNPTNYPIALVQSMISWWSVRLYMTSWTTACQASPFPRVCSNSRPLSQWCHPTNSSSVAPFSCPQSFLASGSFPVSQLFESGGQRTGASASVLPKTIQGWFPLGLTGLISCYLRDSQEASPDL